MVLPVAVDTLHHAVQLTVVSQHSVLVSELLPQLVVQSDSPAGSDRSEVEERQPGLAGILSAGAGPRGFPRLTYGLSWDFLESVFSSFFFSYYQLLGGRS